MNPIAILLFTFSALLTACASPKIYIIDRPTLMESDSSGDWPQAEDHLLKVSQKAGPTFAAEAPNLAKKKRLQNILNGEIEE